ncbi:MAG: hypothetical protein ACOYUZ_01300 [Patescibacteria group bacterium]
MGARAANENTPVQISSGVFILRYGFDWHRVYKPFLKEWGIPHGEPEPASVPESLNILSEVNAGERKLDWCPKGVNVLAHLYPLFISRGMVFDCPGFQERDLIEMQSREDAWIVSSTKRNFSSDQEHYAKVRESGFHRKALMRLDVVQILYLIALAQYRGECYIKQNIPFASPSKSELRFVRTTSYVKRGSYGDCQICLAFVPFEAVFICSIADQRDRPDLLTMDAFILR